MLRHKTIRYKVFHQNSQYSDVTDEYIFLNLKHFYGVVAIHPDQMIRNQCDIKYENDNLGNGYCNNSITTINEYAISFACAYICNH